MKKALSPKAKSALISNGTPRGIRTPDLQIRSLPLYPAELWAHRNK